MLRGRVCGIVFLYILLAARGLSEEITDRPLVFSRVYIVFAEEHSLEFVSGFGHCFVCLAPEKATTVGDLLLAPSLNFGVDTSPLGKGLFTGRYTIQPTFELVRKNSFFQQRRLLFFQLNLTGEDIKRLNVSLESRLSHEYKYDFYRRNCGYYLADWLLEGQARPSNCLPGIMSYLTPRTAVGSIIKEFGTTGGWVINSPGLLAEERLASLPWSERQELVTLHSDLQSISRCNDLYLKLLYIKMLESHANPANYPAISAAHLKLISDEPGKLVERNLAKLEAVKFNEPSTCWPNNYEGMLSSLSLVVNPRSNSLGIGLRWEGGLRDFYTEPRPFSLLRQVHFLSIEPDIFPKQIKTKINLFEIDTIRDLNDLFGVGSSGASILFEEKTNSLGIRGVCVKAWSGAGMKIESTFWACVRLHLIGDQIGRGGRVRLAPEIFLYSVFPCPLSISFSKHSKSGFGYRAEMNWPVGADFRRSLKFDIERSPSGDSRIQLGCALRY